MSSSQPRQTDRDLPKRFHAPGIRVKQDKKYTMMNVADKLETGLPSKAKRPGGCTSNISSEGRDNMAPMSKKQKGQGEPCPWGTSISAENGKLDTLSSPRECKFHEDDTGVHNAYEKMENGQTPTDVVSSKYVLPEIVNMAGDGIPPQKPDSLPNDATVSRQYRVNDKIGSNARLQGAAGCSTSLDDTKVRAASISGSMPSKSPISPAAAKIINDDIKYQLRKEVRKFGRKFERMFTLFEEVQGPLEVKKQFVEFTIKEAKRFKREVLIQDLEKVLEKYTMMIVADKLETGLPSKAKRPGGCTSNISSEGRDNMAPMSKKQKGQGEPCPWGTSISAENGKLDTLSSPRECKFHEDDTGVHNAYEKMENGQTPADVVSSKYVLPEIVNMAGDGIPPQKPDSLPNDATVSRQYRVNDKIGSNARLQGAAGCSTSLDDTKVRAASISGSMPSKSPISPAAAKIINDDIKYQLRKEVRKFGRKFERMFTLFEEVQGPLEVKKQFVEFTIKEAKRFKREVLIQDLEKVLEKVNSHLLNKDNDMENI
ncbi:sarcoma antigen 1 [Tamandua tetradactyla]|uniref:sarcoma antigen 1 n=1 Tax=Tamandua tetradactyla TaxID=48850 RepID=UPI004053EDA7